VPFENPALRFHRICGEAILPGDKSLSHRYLFLAPYANKPVKLKNLSSGLDVRSSIECLRKIGVRIEGEPPDITVFPFFVDQSLHKSMHQLDCGNSGTSARFLMGFLSAFGVCATIDGDESLRKRPMKRVMEPLTMMGGVIDLEHGATLPAVIKEPERLKGISWNMKIPSAQVKTSILLAGLKAHGETVIREERKTRNHTEIILKTAGADIRCEDGAITLQPLTESLRFPNEIIIPGDISTAAFYVVCASILSGSELVLRRILLNPHRAYYLEVLKRMGASLMVLDEAEAFGEKVGDLEVRFSGKLNGIEIGGDESVMCIDEIPALAVAASFAKGKSVFRDLQELHIKESDRLKAIEFNLQKLGIDTRAEGDSLIIEGKSASFHVNPYVQKKDEGKKNARNNLLESEKSILLDSFGDHRIAMAMKIASLAEHRDCIIKGSESVEVSAPEFYEELRRLLIDRKPHNIFLTGFMGSGKSTVGALLAKRMDYSFIDLDERIRTAAGRPIWKIFSEEGEERFRELEKTELMNLAGIEKTVVALGGGVTCDSDNISFICKSGLVILLAAPPEILYQRIKNEKGRPLVKKIDAFQKLFQERYKSGCYFISDITYDSSKSDSTEIVYQLYELVSSLK
jgi:3-phosphoshikimate 1-carboxyvinyltransferase